MNIEDLTIFVRNKLSSFQSEYSIVFGIIYKNFFLDILTNVVIANVLLEKATDSKKKY